MLVFIIKCSMFVLKIFYLVVVADYSPLVVMLIGNSECMSSQEVLVLDLPSLKTSHLILTAITFDTSTIKVIY